MDLAERSSTSPDRHPWEIVRFRFFRQVCERIGSLAGQSWLDVGAGDAWFASQLVGALPEPGPFVCWDINYGPQELAKLQAELPRSVRLTNVRPEGRFDMLLLLDVLEHVSDDRAFLVDLVDNSLAPDGTVIISVPAYQSLFGQHDRFLRHYRRYSPRQCRALMTAAGLEPIAQGGLFHSLLPIRALQVMLERRRRSDEGHETAGLGAWKAGAGITRAIVGVLEAEAAVSLTLGKRQLVFPGLSYWAIAKRSA